MIRSYNYVNEGCRLVDEHGKIQMVPYRENIEEYFALQNEIEYLTNDYEENQKTLGNLLLADYESTSNMKKIGLVSVGGAALCSAICYFILYDVSATLETSACVIAGVNAFSCLFNLSFEDKKKISAYRECIEYEKATLDAKKKELEELELKEDKLPLAVKSLNLEEKLVPDEGLKLIKNELKLRYYFGYNKKKIIDMHKKGILPEVLKANGYYDEVIANFIIYLESYIAKNETEKIEKKAKRAYKTKLFMDRLDRWLEE